MIQRTQHMQAADGHTRPKWFNSAVTFHAGTLTDIRKYIPTFERRGFALAQNGNERSRLNKRLDTIVRLPLGDDKTFIPVGVVSKDYTLVPHDAVIDITEEALDDAKISPSNVKAELINCLIIILTCLC